MSIPSGPKLNYIGSSETSITVSFNIKKDFLYDICWKEYPQDWVSHGESASVPISESEGSAVKYKAEGLNPGTSYAFRIICKDGEGNPGKPGPEMIIDTDTVSCTPHNKCILL